MHLKNCFDPKNAFLLFLPEKNSRNILLFFSGENRVKKAYFGSDKVTVAAKIKKVCEARKLMKARVTEINIV